MAKEPKGCNGISTGRAELALDSYFPCDIPLSFILGGKPLHIRTTNRRAAARPSYLDCQSGSLVFKLYDVHLSKGVSFYLVSLHFFSFLPMRLVTVIRMLQLFSYPVFEHWTTFYPFWEEPVNLMPIAPCAQKAGMIEENLLHERSFL